ncbi:MAG: hypothetical protein RIQ60_570 [Pseudomonadota bacterium]|jgi:hypothetical protein
MTGPSNLTQIPQAHQFRAGDVFVLFGELFGRGYANGLVAQARAAGMTIVGITVGRRETDGRLRPLNDEELAAAEANLGGTIINEPLMAGFDMDAPEGTPNPTEMLGKLTLKTWTEDKLDWDHIAVCREVGVARFKESLARVMARLDGMIPAGAKVFFAHTMAGGIPRAKVFLAIANRIYKGRGERHQSSDVLLQSDLGKLILMNFDEVSANTLGHLIDGSAALRARVEACGGSVCYSAYGYHGTGVLIAGTYKWQSYHNYTQGYAKMRLERIAQDAWAQGVKATVYNCPEIRTNSSDIFSGVELPLFSLLYALRHEQGGAWAEGIWAECADRLSGGTAGLAEVMQRIDAFYASDVMQHYDNFAAWPMANSQALADLMIGTSDDIVAMHKDRNALITDLLSTLVIDASGALMFNESAAPSAPVLWLNHDLIAQQLNRAHA